MSTSAGNYVHMSCVCLHLIVQHIVNLNMQDSLYVHLFEAYLNLYLPYWGVIPISPQFIHNQVKFGCKQPGTYLFWDEAHLKHYHQTSPYQTANNYVNNYVAKKLLSISMSSSGQGLHGSQRDLILKDIGQRY